jgi:predicted esterase
VNMSTSNPDDPHGGQPVLRRGPHPAQARLALLLVHGRGGSAEDMLGLAREFRARDVTILAPQAADNTWYPHSFLAPIEQNEPWITSGLRALARLLQALAQEGLPRDRVVMLGFSQGACLTLEFAARHARRYAAIVGLSGGVIGPPGDARDDDGSMEGTPVLLGCSDRDPHIPVERVHETADIFRRLHAAVDLRIYPKMGHTVNREEIEAVQALLSAGPKE